MNANEMALTANPRLDRIKLVSRSAKYVCHGVWIYSIGSFLLMAAYSSPSLFPAFNRISLATVMVAIQIALWDAFVTLKRSPGLNDHVRLVPLMMLIQLFLWVGYWKMPIDPSAGHIWQNWFWTLYQISTWVWFWKLACLFGLCQQGLFFKAETIRCIKTLGLLCIIGWALISLTHFAQPPIVRTAVSPSQAAMITVRTTHETFTTIRHTSFSGFFSFDFGTGINFGLLFTGAIIILIAWIMDEGRKIQEEQELTV